MPLIYVIEKSALALTYGTVVSEMNDEVTTTMLGHNVFIVNDII